jgi:hypothetical protein
MATLSSPFGKLDAIVRLIVIYSVHNRVDLFWGMLTQRQQQIAHQWRCGHQSSIGIDDIEVITYRLSDDPIIIISDRRTIGKPSIIVHYRASFFG